MRGRAAILSLMGIDDAIEKANRILYEERVLPTVEYHDPVSDWYLASQKPGAKPVPLSAEAEKAFQGRAKYGQGQRLNLETERRMRPRPVHESPDEYVFRSTNYDMLLVLFSQFQNPERGNFVSALLKRIPSELAAHKMHDNARFPSFHGTMSELPLVAEFCVRTGYTRELLKAVSEVQKPTFGLVTLLLELEETIALNFTRFSDTELDTMAISMRPTWDLSMKLKQDLTSKRLQSRGNATSELKEAEAIANEIYLSINGIGDECRKARHFYLKDVLLQQTPNLEIESDKAKVESYIAGLGFSTLLIQSLNEAEKRYRATSSPFELKNCLDHLRSFFENLHIEACNATAATFNVQPPDKEWGKYLVFLKQNGCLSEKEERFAASLYTLISDKGVHPLIAEQEYARLFRNVVIEYGLMFVTALQKKGVKLPVAP